jgi:acetyltransferase-like isoleucine patch superfamily enzyme
MINFFDLKNSLSGRFWAVFLRPFMKKMGKGSRIVKPIKVKGLNRIIIENGVIVNALAWLQVEHVDGVLQIDDGTILGHMNHIYAYKNIYIGKNVLTADKVYISDCLHEYKNIDIPIMHQETIAFPAVTIGDHTWLGENVVVLGASIGKHCVIGSNSVVTKDIPDYSIAIGSPARVIKKYNTTIKTWENIGQ